MPGAAPTFNRMIEPLPFLLDRVFQALADPTRRAMLNELRQGARSVGVLAAPHRISLAAASKHIRTLERAGLLRRTVQGRTHLCALETGPLAEAEDWLRACAPSGDTGIDTGAGAHATAGRAD